MTVRLPILILAFSFTIGMPRAESTLVTRCLLEVDGKAFVDGPCTFWEEDELGSFSFSTFYRQIDYYTAVILAGENRAFGYWNMEPGSVMLNGKLGYLRHDGACWVNERAKACAWK
jgi:hypothetical protein